jgi:hypothetical protein
MAISLEGFRNKLDVKLWATDSPIARNVTVYNLSSSTVDDYGTVFPTHGTGTSVKAIPYSKFTYQQDFLQWGDLQAGETQMVFKYDTSLNKDSLVVDSNGAVTSYKVFDIQPFPYGSGSVAQVARLVEKV